MKTPLQLLALLLACFGAAAQVNSGSNGSDGAFNPTTNIVINMADHPNGIYQFTTVSIPTNVTVTFMPNANSSPVIWLVQGDCTINGTVDVSGQIQTNGTGGLGGPGGFRGGNGGNNPTAGIGPGGGVAAIRPYGSSIAYSIANSASHASAGWYYGQNGPVAPIYGSQFLVPPLGGSGGGGGGGLGRRRRRRCDSHCSIERDRHRERDSKRWWRHEQWRLREFKRCWFRWRHSYLR